MISVVLGAAIALTLASIVLLVDWESLCAFVRDARGCRRYMRSTALPVIEFPRNPVYASDSDDANWPTVFEGPGFKVVADGTVDVSARSYANGSTQVWLKRTAA